MAEAAASEAAAEEAAIGVAIHRSLNEPRVGHGNVSNPIGALAAPRNARVPVPAGQFVAGVPIPAVPVNNVAPAADRRVGGSVVA